ncbi:sensor histidine kinase [Pseudoxanthomonas kaohsiungensis]|uniref:sensor histidine kinase n=1 Tax=Pseudoxanthomonas kaohsiungensis TaxID=283923 RepID=UPI0035B42FEA
MRRPASLRRRMVLWLLAFAAVVSILVFAIGIHVHEHAEHAAWRSLLGSELTAIEEHSARDPGYRWQDSDTLRLYRLDAADGVPDVLQGLHNGLHDNIQVDGRLSAVMVRPSEKMGRLALVLDIEDFHEMESFAERSALLGGIVLIVVTGLAAWLGVSRLVRPLAVLADDIGRLHPGAQAQRIKVARGGSSELYVIADALNDYLERNAQFVERERVFITTASHELRTPLAVIGGATELALGNPALPAQARAQMQRVLRTAQDVEQLIQLLLVLAREPARLAALSEPVELDAVIRQVVEDHAHLLGDKQLAVEFELLAPCTVMAPPGVVRAAIGNLLRNAIESSDSGVVRVALSAAGVATIDDPGHGMSPEEISAIHARLARGTGDDRSEGIGLELIARLCEHLGWRLVFTTRQPQGTRVSLDLGRSRLA